GDVEVVRARRARGSAIGRARVDAAERTACFTDAAFITGVAAVAAVEVELGRTAARSHHDERAHRKVNPAHGLLPLTQIGGCPTQVWPAKSLSVRSRGAIIS